jgi:hypothetical protein
MTLSILTLNAECHYDECHLCRVSFMLSAANKPVMLSVVMLSIVMLSIIMLSIVMLNVVMLSVVMLSVVMPCIIYTECRK